MPISISEHFQLEERKFLKLGAFDALLDWDSKFFVDPFLLQKCKTKEFKGAHQELLKYFNQTLKLISVSTEKGDKAWTAAKKRLHFQEIGGFGLGYAKESTAGSGIGRGFSDQLIGSLKEIVEKGIKDPELFELLGLFEEGVGADRISDMVCNILIHRFAEFTERIFKESGYSGISAKWTIGDKEFSIPVHPFRPKAPVLLAPIEILRDLPTAEDGFDLTKIYAANELLRNKLNQLLGSDWRQELKRAKKSEIRNYFVRSPELLQELIGAYKDVPLQRYDFTKDRAGEIIWRKYAREIVDKFPVPLALDENPDISDICRVVETICDKFREHIENNGLWEVLFDDHGRPRKERIAQRLFFSVAENYCAANNIDLSPESNAGRGPVDFKLSRGTEKKVVVEAKLSKNSKLLDGYSNQVQIYAKSEKAHKAYYLVIKVTEDEERMGKLLALKNELSKTQTNLPEIIIVDGSPKKSASKVRGRGRS